MLMMPFLVVSLGCLLWNAPVVLLKSKMAVQGLMYMFFCKDKKWPKHPDPAPEFAEAAKEGRKITRKTVVFFRHGESTWNDTFNKGERNQKEFLIGWLPGLVKALLTELYLLLSGQVDSWFYDAPLSDVGIAQIDKFAGFLAAPAATDEEAELLSLLRGRSARSTVLVSSNLRRALSTVCIGFRERLAANPGEKIVITPALQEISRNPDTLAITPPHAPVTASWIEKEKLPAIQPILTDRVDMSLHTGNKPLNTNGLKRMCAFCEFAFARPEDALVCGGHSLWFRSFFQTFMPHESGHVARKKKMVNGGAVKFDLLRVEGAGGPVYMVEEKSVVVVYGGF
ncbi:hypothetical protein TeGR_g13769 [Tetraparma gracilis]|uniref:Uncharacterized protein n=1 Tax=Tetraparma gracilis TaxID=2962635 RepID=A0ABQ6NB35_9STRA|nr:hypothetical protein TeGR_g13769 [Tetraparma gracilis]